MTENNNNNNNSSNNMVECGQCGQYHPFEGDYCYYCQIDRDNRCSNKRHCTCGSGRSWIECNFNTPECG